jgi:hypothetical protein
MVGDESDKRKVLEIPSAEDNAESRCITADLVNKIMALLSDREKSLIKMKLFGNCSLEEIARVFGTTRGSVSVYLCNLCPRIRRKLLNIRDRPCTTIDGIKYLGYGGEEQMRRVKQYHISQKVMICEHCRKALNSQEFSWWAFGLCSSCFLLAAPSSVEDVFVNGNWSMRGGRQAC